VTLQEHCSVDRVMTAHPMPLQTDKRLGRWHYERPMLPSKIVGFHALNFLQKPFALEPGCISINVTTALSSKEKPAP
jgi:hypothetical protein